MCIHMQKDHTHVKDLVYSPCQSSVDYGNNKITQHALKMTVMASFVASGR